MKTILKTFLVLILFVLAPQKTEAQFLKKLAEHAKEKIKREAERRSERRVDKQIDKEFDGIEETIDGKNKKKKGKKNKKVKNKGIDTTSNSENSNNPDEQVAEKTNKHNLVWSNYDFVPGDTVIFEDGPDPDEENGEFPSRWDLKEGNVEIVEFDGKKVIGFLTWGSYIVPYLKNSKEDYLPDVFTIEFDVWFPKGGTTSNRFWVYLADIKNQESTSSSLTVMPHSLESGNSDKDYPGTEDIGWSIEKTGSWKHISIAFTKGKFKAYFNDVRLINIPHLGKNPTGITVKAGREGMLLKNFRIAKGGVKYYKRVLSDGKIIVNGIKFDVNKATLKPESMGPINRIYKLMVKNPELKFSVEGHTDSDGSDEFNLKLSKERAKTVMNKLIEMGIDKSRLKYTGFGESKPIDNNSTPEGKANNRRVEFVKF